MEAQVIDGRAAKAAKAANRWLAWLWWTLATALSGVLCLPVAELLGLPVVWGISVRTAGSLPEAAITGAIIGLAQWLVLRGYLSSVRWWAWTAATSAGLVLGIIAVAQSRSLFTVPHLLLGLAADGAILGAALGLFQMLALMPSVKLALVWWPAMTLVGAGFFPIRAGVSLQVSIITFSL